MSGFVAQLAQRWSEANTLVCVGLDPEPARLPAALRGAKDAVFEFNRAIVDATADLVCAFKPQFAHYGALRAEDQLEQTIAYIHARHPGIPVILDAKRGDVGHTAQRYAVEAFDRYCADALTVNAYLGSDSLEPYLARPDKGVIVLCRTSNPGSGDLQGLMVDGKALYQRVAELAATRWNTRGNCLLVVGATYPAELAQVRAIVGDMPILVPGVGAQGGDIAEVMRHGLDRRGAGLLVSSSRAVLYASEDADFAQAARQAAMSLRDEINRHRPRA